MGTESTLYILDNCDGEGRFWAQRLSEAPSQPRALLLRENQRASLLMWLLHAWEEAVGDASEYWVGSLWDIPTVRRYLKALKQQPQLRVLESVMAAQSNMAPASEIRSLSQRDAEALRCFAELLEPAAEVMSLDSWRELCDVCRTTLIEVGRLPWTLHVISESDSLPENDCDIWIPRLQSISTMRWPEWLKKCNSVCATAIRENDRGVPLNPDYSIANAYCWNISEKDEGVDLAEPEPDVPIFQLSGGRLQEWQAKLEKHIFSATELETYLRSPYAYYCERVLKLYEPEEENWDLEAFEVGLVAHNVLENFYSEHSGKLKDKKFDVESGYDQLDYLLDSAIKGLQQERPSLENRLVRRQQKRIRRALQAVLAKDINDIQSQSNPLYPEYFEWSFGTEQTPPLELPGKISLRGTVDRIDIDPIKKTFLIIDYKTGSKVVTGSDIERGNSLQLPIYIEAVRRLLLPGYTPIGGIFFSLGDMSKKNGMLRLDYASDYFELSLRSSSLMAPVKWQEVLDNALDRARETVEHIRSGVFRRCDGICAGYCPYQDMCGCGVVP